MMADTMGIDVVAEGVETEEQMEAAATLGCGYAQGFYFTEPIPADEIEVCSRGPCRRRSDGFPHVQTTDTVVVVKEGTTQREQGGRRWK